jgi:hypothetical protein
MLDPNAAETDMLEGNFGFWQFVVRAGTLYSILAVTMLMLTLVFHHLHMDVILLLGSMQISVFTTRYCLHACAAFRWVACGAVSVMTFVFGISLIPSGLALIDAVQSAAAASVAIVLIVWISTFLLRAKARRIGL